MSQKQEIILKGIPASPSIAEGSAFLYLKKDLDIPRFFVDKQSTNEELLRFDEAIVKTRHQITIIRDDIANRIGENEARIFDSHLLVLEDEAFIEECIDEIKNTNLNVEYCVRKIALKYIDAFSQIDDEFIKERIADIRDVIRRLLLNLMGNTPVGLDRLNQKKIIISQDITPSDTAVIKNGNLLAIVSEMGSHTSHSAIMARSMKIPCVVGVKNLTSQVKDNDWILVDGFNGTVIINPAKETLIKYGKFSQDQKDFSLIVKTSLAYDSQTIDGYNFSLAANIGSIEDLKGAKENLCNGVGLYRTESLFIKQNTFPSQEEQFKEYSRISNEIKDQKLVIRTLDIGGDKNIASFNKSETESNPFMGLRAIRFCLDNLKVFKDQLMAILRASAENKNIKILLPMVSNISEMKEAVNIINQCKNELEQIGQNFDKDIQIGCMIEIPSAALIMQELSKYCSFFSIGTNDLIQYTLAVDRTNDRVAYLYDPANPSVLRLLNYIIKKSQELNRPISVCGEMAADPVFAPLLIAMGASELSVTSSFVPEIKFLLRKLNMKEAQNLLEKIMKEENSEDIIKTLRIFYLEKMRSYLPDIIEN